MTYSYCSCLVLYLDPLSQIILIVFFFNDTATTEIYTLSLHDALPICFLPDGVPEPDAQRDPQARPDQVQHQEHPQAHARPARSEEHTSELQSRQYLVCRLLLEKKKTKP